MEASDLVSRLQSLGLQHKSAVSLEKTEPHYVLDMAAQHKLAQVLLLSHYFFLSCVLIVWFFVWS